MKQVFTIGIILFHFINLHAQNIENINFIGNYTSDEGAEIVTYDSASQRIISAAVNYIEILQLDNNLDLTFVSKISVAPYGGGVNSVAIIDGGYFAAAIEADGKTNDGTVVFFDTNGNYINQVSVGALPDMIKVTPNNQFILTANEGEAHNGIDPKGSVSFIDISAGIQNVSQSDVTTVDFTGVSVDANTIIFPNKTPEFDLEPEYIAIDKNSAKAFVILQENNAVAIFDIPTKTLQTVKGLGFKNHNLAGNGIDASNENPNIEIKNWPVKGVYQPDGTAAYSINGATYFITANEGDARPGFETRVKDLVLDPIAFPNAAALQDKDSLGRLEVFAENVLGDIDNDGDSDELYSFGTRSFSIWDENGNLVFDSGDELAQKIAAMHPTYFNSEGDEESFKDRSDNKGVEPEAVDIAKIGDQFYAFIICERIGGVFTYDVTNPQNPIYVDYTNPSIDSGYVIDKAPESVQFISASKSPNNTNLLIIGNEDSKTVSVFEIQIATNTSTNKELLIENSFTIFPNPTNNDVVFFENEMSVKVYDLTGKLIDEVNQQNSINTSNWISGTYIFINQKGEKQRFVKL